jgi:hypothetical protein
MISVHRTLSGVFLYEINTRSLNEMSCRTRTLKNADDLTVPRNTSHAFLWSVMLCRKIERIGNQGSLRLRIIPYRSNILFLTLH